MGDSSASPDLGGRRDDAWSRAALSVPRRVRSQSFTGRIAVQGSLGALRVE